LGKRRTRARTETPIVRRFLGTTFARISMVAGREIADQEMKRAAPINTAHHDRITITVR
jgi:hypothetical protein